VNHQFSDIFEEISRSNSESALFVPEKKMEGGSIDNERLRLVEERLQMMELLLKSYYINDEIFYELDKARRKKATKLDSLQSNEEIPLSQGIRKRTHSGDNV
jgi:DNA repair ATPase RecN